MARYSLRPPRRRVFSTRGGNVRRQEGLGGFEQGWLIVADGQVVIGSLVVEDLMDGLVLGVEGIELYQPVSEVQAFQERAGGGDFVGLALDRLDAQEPLAGLRDGVDQHDIPAARFLAVDDHHLIRRQRSQQIVLPLNGDLLDLLPWNLVQDPLKYCLNPPAGGRSPLG